MLKTFKKPSVKIVYLEEADIIATSTKEMGIDPEENVDYVDKAPNRSIWGDDWYPFFDIYFASPI